MKRTLALAALLAMTAGATAQTSSPGPEPVRGKAAADLQLDIEVMRRLLLTGLREAKQDTYVVKPGHGASGYIVDYATNALVPQKADPAYPLVDLYQALPSGRDPRIAAEGVYLDRKGVVFTISMPKPVRDPMPTTGATTPTEMSAWERTAKQVRGEKSEPATATTAAPSIADVILKVLAENGSHLRTNEDVVVVVTFRGDAAAATNQMQLYNYSFHPFLAQDVKADNPVSVAAQPFAAGQSPASPVATDPLGHGKSARDFELLGDLHLRQKQYQQAVEAYANALKQFPEQAPTAELYRKSIEALLQVGKFDEAKTLVELAKQHKPKADKPAEKPTAPPKATPVPGKLIISVTKSQLNAVGSEKSMPFDAFKRGAKVDYYPATGAGN